VPEESHHFVRLLAQSPHRKAEVLITGIGRSSVGNALVPRLQAAAPSLVISSGFAGGLQPNLQTGDVLYEGADADMNRRLTGAGARRGRFACVDHVAVGAHEKIHLAESSGADAVEMESGHILRMCQAARIPCTVVRVILDTRDQDLPLDFNSVIRADGKVAPLKLAAAIARNPAIVKRLLALRQQTRIAATALGEALFAAIGP
jgi:nucleoside phosphorylase